VTAFIDWELFHDKRRNLTVYESRLADFLNAVVMTFIEWELFQDKRMILTFSADILIHFI
jgi:hypothetical protein